MIRNFVLFGLVLTAILLWNSTLQAQFGTLSVEKDDIPVVVELFTSQSCSSCPPADRVLEELAGHDNVIALGCHVTYWNHLHWVDKLSHEFCTDRQRAYASYQNSRRVYTPQTIVNGQIEFVGSDRSKTTSAIARAQETSPIKPIHIKQTAENRIEISLPELENRGNHTLWLMGYKRSTTQAIPSGENRGRTVNYVNAVVQLENLGSWDGSSETQTASLKNPLNIDGLAIIGQKDSYGDILAGGQIILAKSQ